MSNPGNPRRVTFAGDVTPSHSNNETAPGISDSIRRSLARTYENSPSEQLSQSELVTAGDRRASSDGLSVRREYPPISADNSIVNAINAQRNEPRPRSNLTVEIERAIEEIRRPHPYENDDPIYDEVYSETPPENPDHSTLLNANVVALSNLVSTLQREIQGMSERMRNLETDRRSSTNHATNSNERRLTYGRTDLDVRHRRSSPIGYMKLKEVMTMIPEFDGMSRHKLQDFLNSCTFALEMIEPINEEALVRGILYTKLRGKARQDFETMTISSYDELKYQLEARYQTKRSTTDLQLDFNALKQKANETALEFGQRVDKLASNLYESTIEGKNLPSWHKNVIQETIQGQALNNFEIGLKDDLKVLVRSRRYTTLQEAIQGAIAEEKLMGRPNSRNYGFTDRKKEESNKLRQSRNSSNCYKCGKQGHYGRDCRSSKYALPKPEKTSRVNIINKYCKHCKRTGHTRKECWRLNKEINKNSNKKNEDKRKSREESDTPKHSRRQRKDSSDSVSSSSSNEEKKKKTSPAIEYRVSHIREKPRKSELKTITLPIQQVKGGLIDTMCDSGSTISLIKLKHLKDETPVQAEKIALIGITGNKLYTIGKTRLTIKLDDRKIKHSFYVIKDETPIEQDCIIGIDFLEKYAFCHFPTAEIIIGKNVFKMKTQRRITLKARSETIVKAATKHNRVGIVKAEEKIPGVYIGNCLVESKDFSCPISMINTTDKEIEIPTPHVKIEKMTSENTAQMCTIQPQKKTKVRTSRKESI